MAHIKQAGPYPGSVAPHEAGVSHPWLLSYKIENVNTVKWHAIAAFETESEAELRGLINLRVWMGEFHGAVDAFCVGKVV